MFSPALQKDTASTGTWDYCYASGKTPWQSSGLGNHAKRYLSRYPQGKCVLEIGCGDGNDAGDFLKSNFQYTGLDISIHAIEQAKFRNPKSNFLVMDIFTRLPKQKFDVVYDKGVFHNLAGPQKREDFARKVASLLKSQGIWLNVSGTADHFDSKVPHGAIFLQHLIAPIERYFEILEIIKAPYGTTDPKRNFMAWHGCFTKR